MHTPQSVIDPKISAVLEELGHPDLKQRQAARRQLVALGQPAVPALTLALFDAREKVQWQAAKALSEICDPASAPALVRALEEINDFGVRWLAAESLICMGPHSLASVLQGLIHHADSIWLRDGARHVLHSLHEGGVDGETMSRLLYALEGAEPALQVPWAASAALDHLKTAG